MSSGGSNSQRDPYPFPKARFDIFFNSQASSIVLKFIILEFVT